MLHRGKVIDARTSECPQTVRECSGCRRRGWPGRRRKRRSIWPGFQRRVIKEILDEEADAVPRGASCNVGHCGARAGFRGRLAGHAEAGQCARRREDCEVGSWLERDNADQALQPLGATSVKVEGSTLKFSVDAIVASFEGKMSGDGKQISGTWSRPPDQFPLTLVRATPDTTWEIPEAPKPSKRMPADADPSFDVATIKPNVSGAATVQQLTII